MNPEELGGVLDLVEDDRELQAFEEAARIGLDPGEDVGILQQDVARSRENLAQDGGLPRAPRPSQDDHGEVQRGSAKDGLDAPGDVLHFGNSKVET